MSISEVRWWIFISLPRILWVGGFFSWFRRGKKSQFKYEVRIKELKRYYKMFFFILFLSPFPALIILLPVEDHSNIFNEYCFVSMSSWKCALLFCGHVFKIVVTSIMLQILLFLPFFKIHHCVSKIHLCCYMNIWSTDCNCCRVLQGVHSPHFTY